jgi:hypothetical protein
MKAIEDEAVKATNATRGDEREEHTLYSKELSTMLLKRPNDMVWV